MTPTVVVLAITAAVLVGLVLIGVGEVHSRRRQARTVPLPVEALPPTDPALVRVDSPRVPPIPTPRARHRRDEAPTGALTMTGVLRKVNADPCATVDEQLRAGR